MKTNKTALRKSFWTSLARVVGVLLSVGAGTALRDYLGNDLRLLLAIAVVGFFLMWISEYLSESAE